MALVGGKIQIRTIYHLLISKKRVGCWYCTSENSGVMLNNPGSVSLLSGLRKPQIRF